MPTLAPFKSDYAYKATQAKSGTLYMSYKTLDSTNWEAERFAKALDESECGVLDNGVVVVANTQANGQGSFYRQWISEPGGLYYSLLLRAPEHLDDAAPGAYARVVAGVLQSFSGLGIMHELPNDLVFGVYKIGGLLLQSFHVHGHPCLIIGVGVNVNQKKFPEPISRFATSLAILTGKSWKKKPLILSLTKTLLKHHF
jgi:BirA family biotin operon repressor/biotin-[acetyl-CoA-carboxylase] ligase